MWWIDLLTVFATSFLFAFVLMGTGLAIIFRKDIKAAWREYQAEKSLLKKQLELFENGTKTTNKRRVP